MSTQPTHDSKFKWWICILLLLASTLNYMDRQVFSLTSKGIKDTLGMSVQEVATMESRFNLAFAVGVFFLGMIADRVNIRIFYPAIVVLWSMAGFASGYATSFMMLLVCRFALGLFEAGNIPFGIITIKRVLRVEERPLGNGMFQSGTALGAIITPFIVLICFGIVERMGIDDPLFAWQLPFRVVGIVGIIWAVLWLCMVRNHHVQSLDSDSGTGSSDTLGAMIQSRKFWIALAATYGAIFSNRKFWIALVVVMSINTPWRSFGFWLPLLMQEEKGYSKESMLLLNPGFFACADLGANAVGFACLLLVRRGFRLHRARLWCFLVCTLMTTLTVLTAVLPAGFLLVAVIYLVGFGALGLFPIYYALSQEISTKDQGKVTGSLSCLNACYLAVLFPLQGLLIDHLKSFSLALGVVGLFPLLGFLVLALFWKEKPT